MNSNILLCSPDFIRANSNISDNINSKVLATAIREVQYNELIEILGEMLLEYLQFLIKEDLIDDDEYKIYKDILDKCQLFITYKVIAEVIMMVNYKIDNAGLVQTRDENLDYADYDKALNLKNYYDRKGDHYCYLLQNFLLKNKKNIPELTECQCKRLHSVLYSAGNPSIFLGGARGRGFGCGFRHF